MTRVWRPATELAAEIGCSDGLIHLWWKEGIVRRKKAPSVWRGPRWLYHSGDAIARGRTRRKLKPMKIGMVFGVVAYRCAVCEFYQPKTSFYADRGNATTGILTRCIDCYKDYHRENYDPKDPRYIKKVKQATAIQKQATANARAVSAWKYPEEIDCIILAWFVQRAYPNCNASQLEDICGIPQRQIRDVLAGADSGRRVTMKLAARMMDGLGLHADLDALYRGMERDRPRWHHRYDYCQRCFRTTVRHIARGLCGTCYDHRHDPEYRPIPENRWSLHAGCCVTCGRNDRKHQAFGKCTSCYRKEWRAGRRARVGSGHGNHGQVQEAADQAPRHQLGWGSDSGRLARHA